MQKVSFSNNNASFTTTLKKRVDEYFASNNLKFTGGKKLYGKTIILVSAAALLYWLLVFAGLPLYVSIPLCGLMGLSFASIGFNVMHDGGHGSYSQKRWVNEMMSYSLNLLGGNAYLWKIKHNNNHHSFTNIEGMDEDIDIRPFMRTSAGQEHKWYHKYQHMYWIALYCLVYISWVFFKDFKKYFSGKIADTRYRKMNVKEHFIFWGSKVVYVVLFLVIPMTQVGVLPTLAGYGIMSAVCGLTLGVIFQLAHVIEGTSVHDVSNEPVRHMNDWTIHQLATTANFSTRNRIMSWFAGGLNFQVEHHLFPRISHIHYPALNKVVKEVCMQFNVKYMEYPSFFTALRSHVAYLRLVGSSK